MLIRLLIKIQKWLGDIFIRSNNLSLILRVYYMPYFHCTMVHVRLAIQALSGMNLQTVVAWIPGHSRIWWNEKADSMAKLALQRIPTQTSKFITFTTCLILKQVETAWQQCWDRSTTGRITHGLISIASNKTIFPKRRCTAVSYIRQTAVEWFCFKGRSISYGTGRH